MILATARRIMPAYLVGCPACDDADTVAELLSAAKTELDLILEGQDGTDDATPKDIAAIRQFIRRLERRPNARP